MPAGFNPSTAFGSYNSQGLLYSPGARSTYPREKAFPAPIPSTIRSFARARSPPPAAQSLGRRTTVSGNGSVSTGGGNLTNGLKIYGNGSVNLGNGNLTVNDVASGMSGGTLSAYNEYIGYSGTGLHQSGGSNAATNNFYLGYNAADSGTYNLSGGTLSSPAGYYTNAVGNEYIGYSGTGTFTQSGGTNTASSTFYLGYYTGSAETYNLSARMLSRSCEYIGCSGTGTFSKSGGTNTAAGGVYVGYGNNAAAGEAYNLAAPAPSAGERVRRLREPGNLLPGRPEPNHGSAGSYTYSRYGRDSGARAVQLERGAPPQQGRVRGLLRRGELTQSGGTNNVCVPLPGLQLGGQRKVQPQWSERTGHRRPVHGLQYGQQRTPRPQRAGALSAPPNHIGYNPPPRPCSSKAAGPTRPPRPHHRPPADVSVERRNAHHQRRLVNRGPSTAATDSGALAPIASSISPPATGKTSPA